MTEQVALLKSFSYLSLLDQRGSKEKIYRLLYDTTTRYFVIPPSQNYYLLEPDGTTHDEDLEPLYDKIRVYQRLFGKSLEHESLEGMLRLNEVEFLLGEINMNRNKLEQQIYQRLMLFVKQQASKPFYDPLLLPKLLAHNDFVSNYLQTNIGYPDGTENYFNRMKIMIEQISERTAYAEVPSYAKIIQVLLLYLDEQQITTPNVILSGMESHCVLRGGMNTLPKSFDQFLTPRLPYLDPDTTTRVNIDNAMIARLIKIYNEVVLE